MEAIQTKSLTTLNFNLREPKAARSIIYAVIKVNDKQIKVSTNEKILTCSWSSKKQECVYMPSLSNEENQRNFNVNLKINEVKVLFNQKLLYFCSVQDVIEEIREICITSTTHIMGRPKTATTLLKEAFNAWKNRGKAKESSIKQYATTLNKFCAHIAESKKADSPKNFLTSKAIEEWALCMAESGTAARTIDENCKFIVKLINDHLTIKYDLQSVRYNKIARNDTTTKKCEILKEELDVLKEANLKGIEAECRDLFLIQCLTGVRVSDLPKLFNGDYKKETTNGITTYTIETKKNEISAYIIITEEITTLLKKYKDGFKHIVPEDSKRFRDKFNKVLKRVFADCGLNRNVSYSVQEGLNKVEKNDSLDKIITTHFARHTFITHKLRQGWSPDVLCHCTGHTDDKMITEIYQHLTATEKAQQHIKEVVKENIRVEGKSPKREPLKPVKVDEKDVKEVHIKIFEQGFVVKDTKQVVKRPKRLS